MSNQLFEPDVLVPSQFFSTQRRQAPSMQGEHRLLVALLDDAVERFKKYVLTGDQHCQEAWNWVMGVADDEGCKQNGPSFSFEYVCDVLGFDPEDVRHGLQRWRNAQPVGPHAKAGQNERRP